MSRIVTKHYKHINFDSRKEKKRIVAKKERIFQSHLKKSEGRAGPVRRDPRITEVFVGNDNFFTDSAV